MANLTKITIAAGVICAVFAFGATRPTSDTAPADSNASAEKKPTTAPGDEKIADLLKQITIKNLEAMQAEDAEAAKATLHSKSPGFAESVRTSQQLFKIFDLNYKVVSFTYIGRDKDYAVARVKQQTTKKAGPKFRDNEIDIMHIFRKEGKQWKFWQSSVLEVKFLNQPK